MTYRYNGLGRRIEKDVNGVVTHYVYDQEDNRSLGGSRCAHRSFNVIIGVLPLAKGFKTADEVGNTAILSQFAEAWAGEQSIKWAKF